MNKRKTTTKTRKKITKRREQYVPFNNDNGNNKMESIIIRIVV